MVRQTISLVMLAAVLAGCRSAPKMKPSTPAPQPATPQRVEQIRQMYQRQNADIRVGLVIATLPQYRLAAVGDIPVKDIALNEIVTFIDGDENPLTTGLVVNKTEDTIHVKYDPFSPGRREPRVGDLAVRLP